MTDPHTILVLGAGASQGFGLPLGADLRSVIADDLNIMFDDWGSELQSGSYRIVEALRAIVRSEDGRQGDINLHRQAAVQIARSMPLSGSIDEYIERHSDDLLKVLCAKLAIAKAILEAERKSSIFSEAHREDYLGSVQDCWLALLLRDVTRGLGKSALKNAFSDLTIVNFNYDRCVQHFAYHWFQRMYDLVPQEAAEICKSIQIYHPYGRLGPLSYEHANGSVPYGADVTASRLLQMASGIRTYSEVAENIADSDTLTDHFANADRVVFLGFGFHRQNVEVLAPIAKGRSFLRCYATAAGIRKARLELIESRVRSTLGQIYRSDVSFNVVSGNCEDLWQEYGELIVR
jgi:hypothetical protein